jgi:hypothetical protein
MKPLVATLTDLEPIRQPAGRGGIISASGHSPSSSKGPMALGWVNAKERSAACKLTNFGCVS